MAFTGCRIAPSEILTAFAYNLSPLSAPSMNLNFPISRRVFQNSSLSLLAANCLSSASVFNLATPKSSAAVTRKRKISIAQIGTSHGHATKISVYRKSDDYEVVGIVEADPARQKQVQELPAFRGLNSATLSQSLSDAFLRINISTSINLPANLCNTFRKSLILQSNASDSCKWDTCTASIQLGSS